MVELVGFPETGTEIEGVNSWTTIQPGLPQGYVDVLDSIQSLLGGLLIVLNTALAILQVLKSFLIGYNDPLVVIVNELVKLVNDLIGDIREIGVYISGDGRITPPQYTEILGGYQAYERRMIGRLVDRSDPTRPDFTAATACVAVFTYGSAGLAGIRTLANDVQRLRVFFGQPNPVESFTIPVGLEVTYGLDGASLATYGSMARGLIAQRSVPDVANIRWQMAPPTSDSPVFFPYLAPKGFLIEVSTLKDGLYLAADTLSKAAQNTSDRTYNILHDPKSGQPFKLYGGGYMVSVADLANASYEPSTNTRFYAFRDAADNTPIPIDKLIDGDKFLLQRTFYIEGGYFNTMGPGQGFAALLRAEDMPYEAEFEVDANGEIQIKTDSIKQASTVYIRISAVTEAVAAVVQTDPVSSALTAPIDNLGFWSTSSSVISSQVQTTGFATLGTAPKFAPSDKSDVSSPLVVTYPSGDTQRFLSAVATALAVLILSRSDIAVSDDFHLGMGNEATGLEGIASFLFPQVINSRQSYFEQRGVSPPDFRADILKRCWTLTSHMYNRTGSLGSLEGNLADQCQSLLDFKLSDIDPSYPSLSILEALADQTGIAGLALNPISTDRYGTDSTWLANYGPEREPGFTTSGKNLNFFLMGQGSCDYSPVTYNKNENTMSYCRNDFADLYGISATILNVISAPLSLVPGQGNWAAYRFFPQSLPFLDRVLEEISAWAQTVGLGLTGVVDVVEAYITFLEARIIELQSLVVRIDGLISILSSYSMPSVNALVVTANGTDGVLQAFVNADNKPSDSVTDYGAGIVLFAGGGISPAIIDIFLSFFNAEEDS